MFEYPIYNYDNVKIADMRVVIREDSLQIHQEVYKWSKETYQIFLIVVDDLKKVAKNYGKDYLSICIKPDNKKDKYYKMFGFEGPIETEDNNVIYYLGV